LIT
ncbi:hypothetical protein FOXB_04728, partial [Fusarium oxysporum f. sp. conglutinans Fo5176]|jgi:hypothetical protein